MQYDINVLFLQGKSQNLEVNLQRVHDSTVQTDLELKTPIRVRVVKSPVTINYRLYQLGVSKNYFDQFYYIDQNKYITQL